MSVLSKGKQKTKKIDIHLPARHNGQLTVIRQAKRFNVLSCGRRWGKTTLGFDLIIQSIIDGKPCAWYAPSYRTLLDVWREFTKVAKDIIERSNAQERRIEFITGAVLEFWSLEDPDVSRGRKYARVIIDEAAMVRHLEEAWTHAIRPTLADYRGDAFFLSTPKGRNYFYALWIMGKDKEYPEWRSWQMPTSSNPHIHEEEVEAMRDGLPEMVFNQEVLAEFLQDDGGVFRNIRNCVVDIDPQSYLNAEGRNYVFGVDWGKLNDWTVITVVDIEDNALVDLVRFNRIDYAVQVTKLENLYNKWRPRIIVVERNSIGEPLIEQLQRRGLPIRPFLTTNASKGQAIESLSLAFEQGIIRIPDDPVLLAELSAYETSRTSGGSFKYGAPSGMHDDCVMSLALAWTQSGHRRSWLFN